MLRCWFNKILTDTLNSVHFTSISEHDFWKKSLNKVIISKLKYVHCTGLETGNLVYRKCQAERILRNRVQYIIVVFLSDILQIVTSFVTKPHHSIYFNQSDTLPFISRAIALLSGPPTARLNNFNTVVIVVFVVIESWRHQLRLYSSPIIMHWIELLTVTTGTTTETSSNAHVGKVSLVMYGYLMLTSLQKNPRLNGGMTSPKSALTRPTMRKHAKSTTWENFPEDILLVALVVPGPKLNTWDYEMSVVWRWSPTQILLCTFVWWVILTNHRTNTYVWLCKVT